MSDKLMSSFTMPEIFDPVSAIGSDMMKQMSDDAFHMRNPVKKMFVNLVKQITEFESKLSPEEEIGARLVAAPGEGFFHVENVTYTLPDMIIFQGKNSHGRPVQLMQHHSQLSVFLTALPKQDDEPRRIGFRLGEQLKAKG